METQIHVYVQSAAVNFFEELFKSTVNQAWYVYISFKSDSAERRSINSLIGCLMNDEI